MRKKRGERKNPVLRNYSGPNMSMKKKLISLLLKCIPLKEQHKFHCETCTKS